MFASGAQAAMSQLVSKPNGFDLPKTTVCGEVEPAAYDIVARSCLWQDRHMKKPALPAFLMLSVSLPSCATTPSVVELQSVEREAVCAMADDIRWGPFGNVEWEEDTSKADMLTAWVKPREFQALPTSLRCATGSKRLHGRKDGTPFDSFWVSDDRDYAAISGGWIAGELTGGGGICYYNRTHDGWRRKGCVETWAV